jgi:1,4-dihydroxy-2-naphthoate octaprenyltransferase
MLGAYVLYVFPFLYYKPKPKTLTRSSRQTWIYAHLKRFYITAAVVIFVLLLLAYPYFKVFAPLVYHGIAVGIITVLYELPLIPYKGRLLALRQWGFMKPIILTFVWWYLCAYGVASGWGLPKLPATALTLNHWLLLVVQFIFMLELCVMFDVRDFELDATNKINTWPVKWGIKNTQRALNTLSVVAMVIMLFTNISAAYKVSLGLVFLILIVLNSQKNTNRPWWFYDFVVDGMMVVQCALLYLALWLG